MTDIVKRLREGHQYSGIVSRVDAEAADKIERLEAKIERLLAALKPFVEFLAAYPRPRIHVSADDTIIVSAYEVHLTLGHLDRALVALDVEQKVETI